MNPTYQNRWINAIKLYLKVSRLEFPDLDDIERPRKQRKLPNVLSPDEVQAIFYNTPNLKHRALLMLVYGAGLRIGEALNPYFFKPTTNATSTTEKIYYDEQRKRHSFWYSFTEGGQIMEVIKARIKRKNDPNYWETSRPLAWAGMRTRTDKNERDKPIIKNVVYLDFRAELSAFDKFFYFGNLKNSKARNKQEFLRRKSTSLNKLFTGTSTQINSSTRSLNDPIEHFTDEELRWISFVLGREYVSGISVLHELFRNEGYSILFQTNFAKYSEAVAGSGEMAVVRLVREVLSAENYSLILLDEPEVSLHPGAQTRLMLFLLKQIEIKKHQIILTSHSPSIVKDLPKEAIKVFYQNPRNGRFLIKENLTAEEAFYHIEFPVANRKNIIVEDVLAKEIVSGVLDKMGEETKNLFNIKYNPGGQSVIKREFITVFCREPNANDYVFFDGDQQPAYPHYDWTSFSVSDLTVDFLKTKIKEQSKEEIKFSVDGGQTGGDQQQQIELQKSFLDYYLTNVFYLPKQIPEDIIWSCELAENLIKGVVPNMTEVTRLLSELSNIQETKQKFAFVSDIVQGENSADAISSIHRQFIQRWLYCENQDFRAIKDNITTIVNSV